MLSMTLARSPVNGGAKQSNPGNAHYLNPRPVPQIYGGWRVGTNRLRIDLVNTKPNPENTGPWGIYVEGSVCFTCEPIEPPIRTTSPSAPGSCSYEHMQCPDGCSLTLCSTSIKALLFGAGAVFARLHQGAGVHMLLCNLERRARSHRK